MDSRYRWIDVVAVELLFLHRVKCSTVERQRVSSNDEWWKVEKNAHTGARSIYHKSLLRCSSFDKSEKRRGEKRRRNERREEKNEMCISTIIGWERQMSIFFLTNVDGEDVEENERKREREETKKENVYLFSIRPLWLTSVCRCNMAKNKWLDTKKKRRQRQWGQRQGRRRRRLDVGVKENKIEWMIDCLRSDCRSSSRLPWHLIDSDSFSLIDGSTSCDLDRLIDCLTHQVCVGSLICLKCTYNGIVFASLSSRSM